MEEMIRRVEKLEKENKRWRLVTLTVFLSLTGVIFMGQRGSKALECEKLLLKDVNGVMRAGLSVATNGGVQLNLFAESSKNKAGLQLFTSKEGQSSVVLYDENGDTRANLNMTNKNAVQLNLFPALSAENKSGLQLYMDSDGYSAVILYDKNGVQRAIYDLAETPEIRLSDENKNVIWKTSQR